MLAEAFLQADLQSVVIGIGDTRNQADGRKIARRRLRNGAAGKEPALVGVIRRGTIKRGGIAFDKSRQLGAFSAHVAGFKQPVGTKRSFDVQVPVLRVRKAQILVQRQQGHGLRKAAVERIRSIVWIGKIRQADLRRHQERRRADRRLQRPALARVVGLVEKSIGGGNQPLGVALHIPRQAHARRKRIFLGLDQASRNAGVTGIKQASRGRRKNLRLHARFKQALAIVNFGIGKR